MALTVTDQLKAEGIATAVSLITGSRPRVDKKADHYLITPTPQQAAALRATLAAWWDSAPGSVRVDVKPVLVPFALQRGLPWMVGAAALGGVLLFLFKKG